ncbi:hypothetical protein [Streptomyces brevispora]|uniref:hypothetical protein n=1 Tax=Streptomyces brevispora TaxID=887462 RepID=UPI0038127AD0
MSGAVPRVAIGTVAVDQRTIGIGEVMGFVGPYVQLRPLGGGKEWDAAPGAVRPASPQERLRASLAVANARSSRSTPGSGPARLRSAMPPEHPPGR